MRLPYRKRPSVGFVALVATIVVSATFFTWGLSTPPLDEVWRMEIELDLSERPPLSGREFTIFQAALLRHPPLAPSLIDDEGSYGLISAHDDGIVEGDYAYLVRTRVDASQVLAVETEGDSDLAIPITARVGSSRFAGNARADEPLVWRLPDAPMPQLIEVRIGKPAGKSGKTRHRAVSVRLGGARDDTGSAP